MWADRVTNVTDADLAVIGGGQLARMMQQPALALGLRLRLLAEGPDVSAAQVIADHVVGDYTDLDTLRTAVADAPVVTFDHEHVPPGHLRTLRDEGHACRPAPEALLYAQDKVEMRTRLTLLDVPCPRWRVVDSVEALQSFARETGGYPVVLKTARGGYDGKGVWFPASADDVSEELFDAADVALLAEEKIDFRRELSVLVARRPSGQSIVYPVVESRQTDGICKEVIAPAPDLDEALAKSAQDLAVQIASALDVTGILAVELFETRDGRVLVNELAMRPHNTGHWSIDGAVTSQFEQHLRAVLDLPLGDPSPREDWSVMINILGGPADGDLEGRLPAALEAHRRAKVHTYGKAPRPGRKVGHVTVSGDDLDDVAYDARAAASFFA